MKEKFVFLIWGMLFEQLLFVQLMYGTTKSIERNVCLDTNTKAIERENKSIINVWERGLFQKL